ncbi:MAG: YebC/PmpR family DNA-binding transcriptional regulator [Candidatus Chaera renei]|uniref:Probable transcriptional regulatory protein EOT04_00605 n=1 Tax=Candidatus Chaera renei TaxID=2506947 RepID=A0A4Q0AJX2_9BACT|nr:MAG: YebC/PmpR family DNA-binding transcriptional regulator [Candidatus Chaera renei]
MAGHSKWAQIKRQKGVNDAKRGALFTKLGNQISIAARGGSDPAMNPSLAMVIEKAKNANMPLSNIQRAIARVADKSAATMEEVLYEGYGPLGVAILVECATENKNRTYPEVRHAFTKHGGTIAASGSVSFMFERRGVVRLKETGDEAMMAALEAGALDVQEAAGESAVYTQPKQLAKVRDTLRAAGYTVIEAELIYLPQNVVKIQDAAAAEKIVRLMEALDDIDDVVNVYVNFEIDESRA